MEANTMKKYSEILNDIQKARAAMKDTAKTESEIARTMLIDARRGGGGDLERARAEYDAAMEQYKKENEHNETQKLKIEILKENAAQALFSENIKTICDIWNKYESKPHGEKTAQKIRNEIESATGLRVYIGNKYDDANIKIYFSYGAPHNDLEFVPIWNGEKQPALIDNKIVKIAAENMRVYCCGEYVENVNAHIKAIRKAHAAALEAEKALENAISIYNKLTRGNIQHASQRDGVKKYLI
jgi:hypothetical protein